MLGRPSINRSHGPCEIAWPGAGCELSRIYGWRASTRMDRQATSARRRPAADQAQRILNRSGLEQRLNGLQDVLQRE
jgi:hypothetical protein